ncbi:carbohydrate ABC transporter permease [Thermogemmatispora carboxidivorans]|uniref:carbohydrate ABC transporter permease n=1 Tax=Thermogemmatispora carboxidivorans TaxID=1382306 RepID=UPI0009DD80D6|nr:sugar ABC transporter permease [Thermogemmatispora carboxidivorans]
MDLSIEKAVPVALPPRRRRLRLPVEAWAWIAPAIMLLLLFFVYPFINTIQLSFENADSTRFVGLKNYQAIFTDPEMLAVLKNNLLWLLFGTLLTVGLGLVIAVLVDRVKVEGLVKSALFIPMAISMVSASIIWRLVYLYRSPDQTQIGLLNAMLGLFKLPPQPWLVNPSVNTFALIAVYVWMWTGFCVVVFSAALKGLPDEIIEAARIDGANRWVLFWRVIVPMISPTIGVVTTTMIINILKTFDIVYVMTGGNYNTDVVAVEFYRQLFTFEDYGLASALAVLLTLAILPVMYLNIRRMRLEEGGQA